MRVMFMRQMVVAVNDYGQIAKIEGKLYTLFMTTVLKRKVTSKKRDETIAREIAQDWADADWLEWVDIKDASK